MRFPSILDEKRRFDKQIFVDEPKFNSIMSRNYKVLNNDSVFGYDHKTTVKIEPGLKFQTPLYRSINFDS